MATLVLTSVGTAVGGPIGGALGSLLGQAIDTQLFGKGLRKGPRLDDLKVQTSSYGTQIPRLYGTMRVAGTVIWATDFQESQELEGGGKGNPEMLSYSYSCSFAVALSSRRITSVGRIWADGKLIRGALGDLKVQGKFRILDGGEDQAADPLIGQIEGQDNTPAYRGLALAVFEDLRLAPFGNRIPILTFEVIADASPVDIPSLVADATDGHVAAGDATGDSVGGYAVFGSDQRSAIGEICDLFDVRARVVGDSLTSSDQAPVSLATSEERGWSTDGKPRSADGEWTQEPAGKQPATLSLHYHDPSRDYQAGAMRASMPGGRGDIVLDSAAAMSAGAAKTRAERAIARFWAGRDRLTLRLSPDYLELVPGARLEAGWRAGQWLVEEVRIEGYAVVADCRRLAGCGTTMPADPGRSMPQPDVPIGPTTIALFDLPDLGGDRTGAATIHVAASARGDFRPVPLTSEVAGQRGPSATATRRATLGFATTVLGAAPTTLIDMVSMVEIALIDPEQFLLNADIDAIDAGVNSCMLGDELLQFMRAAPLGGGRFRLSGLLRGRRGTEHAVGAHAEGDAFVLVDRSVLVPLAFDASLLGQDVEAFAHGVADDEAEPPCARAQLRGSASRALAPCHLQRNASGLSWVRRSRANWGWADAIADDISPALFDVELRGPAGVLRTTTDRFELVVSSDDWAVLGVGPVHVAVAQVSDGRRSIAAERVFAN